MRPRTGYKRCKCVGDSEAALSRGRRGRGGGRGKAGRGGGETWLEGRADKREVWASGIKEAAGREEIIRMKKKRKKITGKNNTHGPREVRRGGSLHQQKRKEKKVPFCVLYEGRIEARRGKL